MKRWKHTLDLTPEWEQCKREEIDVHQLARVIAQRLERLYQRTQDGELFDLIGWFEDAAEDPNIQTHDFDMIMTDLYNWADYDKTCWIKTSV